MHSVGYYNAQSSWHEALPIGNGTFGAMTFFKNNTLTFVLNHYEVYYKKLHMYSKEYKEQLEQGKLDLKNSFFGPTYPEMLKASRQKYRDALEQPFYHYSDVFTDYHRIYGRQPVGESHYISGELSFRVARCLLSPDNYSLKLETEAARVCFDAEKAGRTLQINAIAARNKDCIIYDIKQSEQGLLESICFGIPERRLQQRDVEYSIQGESQIICRCSFYPDGENQDENEPFSFVVMTKIIGAKIKEVVNSAHVEAILEEAGKNIRVITTIVTREQTPELLQAANLKMQEAETGIEKIYIEHRDYWGSFFSKSAVSIPDKLLEDLWYINLYVLACGSGAKGRMYQQAMGLNGLWDIMQPTVWGSMWYWDANIQASFQPFYTANHLELAEGFNDALLSYTRLAEMFAQQFYGLEGYAMDYPFSFYLSIWPWCAQYFWWYFQYSMDYAFLREKACPLFRNIIKFIEGYIQYDKDKNQYYFFPDISPEQGPVARNSVITLATVRFLFSIALEADEILGLNNLNEPRWREILNNLAPYPTVDSGCYGVILRDSENAPKNFRLRHPSLLMPIFPIGEYNAQSGPDLLEIAKNTLKFAEQEMETGLFQFGWLACSAARLGEGDWAIRLLYEKGLDLNLRPNGLMAEETDRWINHCNIMNNPLYYPPMMEASGNLVSSVNEMLLQSYDGVIRVFPAIPNGVCDPERLAGMENHRIEELVPHYTSWENCGFKGLLAQGAFEVSSLRKDGKTMEICIKSLAGIPAKVMSPFSDAKIICIQEDDVASIEFSRMGDVLYFPTIKNAEYKICEQDYEQAGTLAMPQEEKLKGDCRVHMAHTFRRIYLGKDKNTKFVKMLDNFTFDYYAGNSRESKASVYRLDFGTDENTLPKDYSKFLKRQTHVDAQLGQNFRRITTGSEFSRYTGVGWENCRGLGYKDTKEPDMFRRDFIYGYEPATFILELPAGLYEILLVSGDENDQTYTELEVDGRCVLSPENPLKKSEFMQEIFTVCTKDDEYTRFTFKSRKGCRWTVNLMIVNKRYRFL